MTTVATTTDVERPRQQVTLLRWLRQNLFNSWYNSLLTLLVLWLLIRVTPALVGWLLQANWAPVLSRPVLYFVGQYPAQELWRPAIGVIFISFLFGLSWGVWRGPLRTF